jgi:hypothetical protein
MDKGIGMIIISEISGGGLGRVAILAKMTCHAWDLSSCNTTPISKAELY